MAAKILQTNAAHCVLYMIKFARSVKKLVSINNKYILAVATGEYTLIAAPHFIQSFTLTRQLLTPNFTPVLYPRHFT